jgi:hypothetical protein
MSNINRLLNIYFIPRDMIHLGQDLVKPVIHEKLANFKHELKTITFETLQSKTSIGYEQEEVYSLFFSGFETDKSQLNWLFNSKRILRRLSYIIGFKTQKKASILDNSETLLVALNLFKSNWSSQYLFGLVDNCLEHFLHPNIEILRQFILSILQNPQSEQDKIWSKYQNFTLISKGPVNLAYYLLKENIALKKGNGAIGLGDHIKSYVYYQEVAKAYIHLAILKKQWEDVLEPTLYFLRDQKQPELSKQILTPIILAIEDMPQNLHRENIQKKNA